MKFQKSNSARPGVGPGSLGDSVGVHSSVLEKGHCARIHLGINQKSHLKFQKKGLSGYKINGD